MSGVLHRRGDAGGQRPPTAPTHFSTENKDMTTAVKLAVIYYSSTGFSAEIAKEISQAAEKAGAEVRLLKAAELAPEAAISSNEAWAAHAAASAGIPVATPADVEWADAVIFGSPTRFGNISSQLKQFIDTLGGLWAQGKLADKVYSGFVTTVTAHGGQESTLLALYNSIHHFGGLVVSPVTPTRSSSSTATPTAPRTSTPRATTPSATRPATPPVTRPSASSRSRAPSRPASPPDPSRPGPGSSALPLLGQPVAPGTSHSVMGHRYRIAVPYWIRCPPGVGELLSMLAPNAT